MFSRVRGEEGGLGFVGVNDKIVACCPVCDGIKIWLNDSFCCTVVWMGCCYSDVICVASNVDEMVVWYGNVRYVEVEQGG